MANIAPERIYMSITTLFPEDRNSKIHFSEYLIVEEEKVYISPAATSRTVGSRAINVRSQYLCWLFINRETICQKIEAAKKSKNNPKRINNYVCC
jgi:hypothetical protein